MKTLTTLITIVAFIFALTWTAPHAHADLTNVDYGAQVHYSNGTTLLHGADYTGDLFYMNGTILADGSGHLYGDGSHVTNLGATLISGTVTGITFTNPVILSGTSTGGVITGGTDVSPVVSGTTSGTIVDKTTRTITGAVTYSGSAGALILSGTPTLGAGTAGQVIVSGTTIVIYTSGSHGLIFVPTGTF